MSEYSIQQELISQQSRLKGLVDTSNDCLDELNKTYATLIEYYDKTSDHTYSYEVYKDIMTVLDSIPSQDAGFITLRHKIVQSNDIAEIIFLYDDRNKLNHPIVTNPISIQSVRKTPNLWSSRFYSPQKLRTQKSAQTETNQHSSICGVNKYSGQSPKQTPKHNPKPTPNQTPMQTPKHTPKQSQRPSKMASQQEIKLYTPGKDDQMKQFQLMQNQTSTLNNQPVTKLDEAFFLYERCVREKEDMRVDAAYHTAQAFETVRAKLTPSELESFYTKHLDAKIYLMEIDKTYTYMQQNLKELNSDGWQIDKAKNGITVKYKFLPNNPSVSILMESTIPVEAIKLAALINETEFYPKYVPFCRQAGVFKHLNRSTRVAYSMMYFPIIPNREAVFVGEAIDRLQEGGSFILMARSIDKDKEFQKAVGVEIPDTNKVVRLQIHYYIFEIRPITRTSCHVRAITNCDPQVPMVPNSVLAFIGRKFAFLLFERIINYAKKFETSPWYPKFVESKEFYDWVQAKIEAFHQRQDIKL